MQGTRWMSVGNGHINQGISINWVDVQPFIRVFGKTFVQYNVEAEITGSGY